MYNVLVFGITENPGGVESFLLSYYRRIDRTSIHFDFLCNTHNKVAYEDELNALGGKIIHISARSRNLLRYRKELDDFMRKHAYEYDAVWVNVCSLANIDYLKVAKKYGIKKRIIHSHNSQNMDSRARMILHCINRNRIQKYATDFWACSEDAAKWFYDEELLKSAVIVRNAIELHRVEFSDIKRDLIRSEYAIDDKFVIGNVGRLHFQKNQMFALDIMRCLSLKMPDCVFMLVGQGEDEVKLRAHAKELGIENKVIFAGVQSDICAYLSAFDLFLFPSVFEGLSIAGLEAQANGLTVIASYGVVPEGLKLTDNFHFKKLEDGAESWADEIEKLSANTMRTDKSIIARNFTDAGYNIETEVERLEKLLME